MLLKWNLVCVYLGYALIVTVKTKKYLITGKQRIVIRPCKIPQDKQVIYRVMHSVLKGKYGVLLQLVILLSDNWHEIKMLFDNRTNLKHLFAENPPFIKKNSWFIIPALSDHTHITILDTIEYCLTSTEYQGHYKKA